MPSICASSLVVATRPAHTVDIDRLGSHNQVNDLKAATELRDGLTMTVAESIRQKLTESLDPQQIQLIDESHLHAGHAGARPEGETHFRALIVSGAFEGKSRVARQRLVYEILAEELATRVHALSLTTLAPSEYTEGR